MSCLICDLCLVFEMCGRAEARRARPTREATASKPQKQKCGERTGQGSANKVRCTMVPVVLCVVGESGWDAWGGVQITRM